MISSLAASPWRPKSYGGRPPEWTLTLASRHGEWIEHDEARRRTRKTGRCELTGAIVGVPGFNGFK